MLKNEIENFSWILKLQSELEWVYVLTFCGGGEGWSAIEKTSTKENIKLVYETNWILING